MTREQLQKSVLLYLYWLGFITALLIVVLTELLPFQIDFVTPDNLFLCLMEAEIFFVLGIWPLFIPSLLRMQEARGAEYRQAPILLLQVALLLLFALPLVVICGTVSRASWELILQSHFFVAILAVFVALLYTAAHLRGWKIGTWYYLSFFIISAALPFLYFLMGEHNGEGSAYLAQISPFVAAVEPGPALAQSMVLGGLSLVLFAVLPYLRAPLDSAKVAQ